MSPGNETSEHAAMRQWALPSADMDGHGRLGGAAKALHLVNTAHLASKTHGFVLFQT